MPCSTKADWGMVPDLASRSVIMSVAAIYLSSAAFDDDFLSLFFAIHTAEFTIVLLLRLFVFLF